MFYLHLSTDESMGFAENVYMELDSERWQTKIVEIYKNGKVAYAYDNIEHNTFLAETQYPKPNEINGVEGYEGMYLENVTKEVFYNIWNKFIKD